ncbi:hypothetical protein V7112_23775, partial [Bacillus sp. JJ1566]|uniref:glucosamine inositolphosphorylceramide transferase family protein n=1 Tax=Bacillus sp. JJ1566 TaxID=3122961 RepID=UPI003B5DEB6B
KGIIGLAISEDGQNWKYDKVVLKEEFHLSYPYVFEFNGEFYMIPETCEENKILLYKAKNFPYEWTLASELVTGSYVDSSIFRFNNKWWMFAAKSGKLHLFFSEKLEKDWMEHPMSPLITNNKRITRPGGRVIVENGKIYRYTQDGYPNYGSAVNVFKITKLTENDYEEEQINLVLSGTKKENDWNSDGMHTIDQLKLGDNNWLIVVDGHKFERRNHLLWKMDRISAKTLSLLQLRNN